MDDETERKGREAPEPGAGTIDEAIAALDRSLGELRSQLDALKRQPERPGPGASPPDTGSEAAPHGGQAYVPPHVPHHAEGPAPRFEPSFDEPSERPPAGEPAGPTLTAATGAPDAPGEDARRLLARAKGLAQALVAAIAELEASTGEAEERGPHGGLPDPAWERPAVAPATKMETLEAGPFETLDELRALEARLARLPYTDDVHVRSLAEGWATIEVCARAELSLEQELPFVLGESYAVSRSDEGRLRVEVPAGQAGREPS